MTDLTAGTGGAVDRLTVNDNAAANTGTQGNQHHGLIALAAALPAFAQGSHSCVVTSNNSHTQQRLQSFLHAEMTPAQVIAAGHDALVVDGTGNADTHAQDVLPADVIFFHVLQNSRSNIRQDVLAFLCGIGGDFPLMKHCTGLIKVGQLDGSTAQVNTETIFHVHNLQSFSIMQYSTRLIKNLPRKKTRCKKHRVKNVNLNLQ